MLHRYEQWNEALAHHFFNANNAGQPVYLLVDCESLHEIGQQHGHDGDSSQAFIKSVKDKWDVTKYSKEHPFNAIRLHTNRWKSQTKNYPHQAPPFIGLLGLSVLAATRMNNDPKHGIDFKNYYVHLNELLGRREQGQPNGFDDLTECWRLLNEWLECNEHQLGRPTAKTHDTFPHIGYPISQCLLRSGDRNKLGEFFLWEGLEPDDYVSPSDLVPRLKIWSGKTTCTLSSQARNLLQSDNNELLLQASEIVVAELLQWQGAIRSSEGYYTAPIDIHLDMKKRGRKFQCSLYPRALKGFPEGRYFSNGQYFQLDYLEGTNWFNPLPDDLIAFAFNNGLELESKRHNKLSLNPKCIIPFRSIDINPGGWMSQNRLQLGEQHVILCAEDSVYSVSKFLETYAIDGWKKSPRTAGLPDGWKCFLDVVINGFVPERNDELACLVPKQNIGIKFSGGLKTDTDSWLLACPPTVNISAGVTSPIPVSINEQIVAYTSNGIAIVSLDEIELGPGLCCIKVGENQRKIHLHESGDGTIRQKSNKLLAYSFERRERIASPTKLYPEFHNPESLPYSDKLILSGTQFFASEEHFPEPLKDLVRVPLQAKRCILLGKVPGQILEVEMNRDSGFPYWFEQKYLPTRESTYLPTSFSPQWVITIGRKNRKKLIPVGKPDYPSREIAETVDLNAWIRWAKKRPKLSKRNSCYYEIWEEYRKLALFLQKEMCYEL